MSWTTGAKSAVKLLLGQTKSFQRTPWMATLLQTAGTGLQVVLVAGASGFLVRACDAIRFYLSFTTGRRLTVPIMIMAFTPAFSI
jgi:hypothetical protein